MCVCFSALMNMMVTVAPCSLVCLFFLTFSHHFEAPGTSTHTLKHTHTRTHIHIHVYVHTSAPTHTHSNPHTSTSLFSVTASHSLSLPGFSPSGAYSCSLGVWSGAPTCNGASYHRLSFHTHLSHFGMLD